jgi:hypothetical protein
MSPWTFTESVARAGSEMSKTPSAASASESKTGEPRLSAPERDALLIRRKWTAAERRIVFHGFLGRAAIAAEPLLCGLVFGGLTYGIWVRGLWFLTPIFGLAVVAFTIYTVVLLAKPLRALVKTYGPIYIVDGYVRYREPDAHSDDGTNGYVAVLLHDQRLCCEWQSYGRNPLPLGSYPALVEYSEYGGIHAIDGRATGILPKSTRALNIGMVHPTKRTLDDV